MLFSRLKRALSSASALNPVQTIGCLEDTCLTVSLQFLTIYWVLLWASMSQSREWLSRRKETIRPWGTFIKTTNFQTPTSLPKLSKRMYRNVDYFQSNYVFVFVILFLYCLITSPLLLIVMAAAGGAGYIASIKQAERKLILGGKEISLAQQYAAISLAAVPLFLLAGAGSAVFWVIGASFFFIGIHAAFYNHDALDVVPEDQEQLTGSIVEEV